jgi:hypothetical protein
MRKIIYHPNDKIPSKEDEFVSWQDMNQEERESLSKAYASTKAGHLHSWDEVEMQLRNLISNPQKSQ